MVPMSPTQTAVKSAREPAEKPAAITPMMAQYFEIKSVNPGYLLFYRMGDFYELFFDDAEVASAALGIVLTKRGKHQGQEIPMCGVPIHAAQDYLKKLIALGHRVAICEQVEDPAEAKKRGSKSVVKRDVVRLITPGTLTEDDHLEARANNFLGALALVRHGEKDFALAWADISTGEMFVADCGIENLLDELTRLDLAELIVPQQVRDELEVLHLPESLSSLLTVRDDVSFQSETGARLLAESFDGIDPSAFPRAGRAALGGLLAYVAETQKNPDTPLSPPRLDAASRHMAIDQATRNSLELITTSKGARQGGLLAAIDRTVTAPGARLLARRLSAPLLDPDEINARLDMVSHFVASHTGRDALRKLLRATPDLTRPLSRLGLGRGGPRDLQQIGQTIVGATQLAEALEETENLPEGLAAVAGTLKAAPTGLAEHIGAALADDVPLLARDGGFVREGFHAELDGERKLGTQTRAVIAELQADLAEETGIKNLRIKHNNMLGFFIEVQAAAGQKLLAEPFLGKFIHRQTMANAMRFTTKELAELEGRIARAQDNAVGLELAIFAELEAETIGLAEPLREVAAAIAELDVTAALAHLAANDNYCRPTVDGSLDFAIEGGRHPVVEQMLARQHQTFVTNDCDLSGSEGDQPGGCIWLVTGPNMGGKSTFLRQNALIALLAQIGSFVPASSARIGVVDKLFSRVGASDDIAEGRSTFMVEMVETAAILNRATSRSLVILDEIGRGTATFDGLSIAWAAAEALHEANRCRTLFATHFHELTSLSSTLERLTNHTMKVREWQGEVVFLHEVAAGAADRSYGIQVAKLAGLPEPVLERARQVLTHLEEQPTGVGSGVLEDLPLFTHRPAPEKRAQGPDPVLDMIDQLRPDDLTPREAIEFAYELKKARNAGRRD